MAAQSIPIIVTRAEPGASATMAYLSSRDLNAMRAPVLSLEPLPQTPLPDWQDLSGLVFTSANGVRTYAERRTDRALTAWCVGPATAEAAREAGFSDIRESAGDAMNLAAFIAQQRLPSDQPLLHVANQAAKGTLKQTLTALGIGVLFAPLYAMRPTDELPAEIEQLIARRAPAIVLVHSAKGAAAFANLIGEEALKDWRLVAISEQARSPLAAIARKHTYIADEPNEAGLMRALDIALATLSA